MSSKNLELKAYIPYLQMEKVEAKKSVTILLNTH